MRRVFLVDLLECPRCQGRMRILAAIVQPEISAKMAALRAPPADFPAL